MIRKAVSSKRWSCEAVKAFGVPCRVCLGSHWGQVDAPCRAGYGLRQSPFKEFSASPERIASNILADRLGRLVRSGLAESFTPSPTAGRQGYRLTHKGKSLLPVLGSLRDWGLAHIKGTEARMKPVI